MDLTSLTPTLLTELLKLAELKEKLEKQIVSIDAQIDAVASGLKPSKAPVVKKEKVASKKKVTPKRAKHRSGSQAVLEALTAAGPGGALISQISQKVSVSGAYLNAILGTLVKQGKAIRVGRGAYAAKSSESAKSSSPVTESSPAEPTVAP